MAAVVVYVYGSVVDGRGDDDSAAAACQLMTRTRNSIRLDAKANNLTRRCNRKFNKANIEKIMQRLRLVRIG